MKKYKQTLIERLDEIKANSVSDEDYKRVWGEDIDKTIDITMTEIKIAEIFERVGLAKIVRELKNDALTNAVESAMIELAEDTSDKLKQVVINQKAIDYINVNKERFEMTLPVIGECWNIDKVITYPLVNEGKPVLELSREENFMRLPQELFDQMDKTPISAEFLKDKGFCQLKHQQYKHLVYSKIYHSSVYGDIIIRIDVADKESSMEASRLPTVDERGCRGYSSFWLPNPTYVYQFQLALDLLEIKD